MNCNDIARILDTHGGANGSSLGTAGVEAHVAACEHCAGQLVAARSLASFRTDVPPVPATLQARARQLQDQFDARAAGRPTRRPVLIGSLLLLGAAATMFVVAPGSDDRATA